MVYSIGPGYLCSGGDYLIPLIGLCHGQLSPMYARVAWALSVQSAIRVRRLESRYMFQRICVSQKIWPKYAIRDEITRWDGESNLDAYS